VRARERARFGRVDTRCPRLPRSPARDLAGNRRTARTATDRRGPHPRRSSRLPFPAAACGLVRDADLRRAPVIAMTSVAVVAHSGKSIGGGLGELRAVLEASGVTDPLWYEVPKSKRAPKQVRKALADGADLLFVWGGDGMVQQCIDVIAGSNATVAIVPAGTANLFATNLGIPKDIEAAVELGLHGDRRAFDVGVLNGEHFVVMAVARLDAPMIREADGRAKSRFGRAAYLWTGAKNLRSPRVGARVRVDGATWFKGKVSCVLIGNVGKVMGNIAACPGARPDDGLLELGVVT